jgi:hypothetical protein
VSETAAIVKTKKKEITSLPDNIGGVACGDYGLELDECVVKKMQFAFKTTHVFSTPVSFKTGLVP